MQALTDRVLINCSHCGASFHLARERYEQLKGRKAQCKRCNEILIVQASSAAEASTPVGEVLRVKAAVAKVQPMGFAQAAPPLVPAPVSQTPVEVRRYQCFQCRGWFEVSSIYSVGDLYQCHRCHQQQNTMPNLPTVQGHNPVVIQNVINNTIMTQTRRWSPGVAALLSFLWPGLGQLYKGQVLNGLVWMVVVFVGYLLFVIPGLILHICCICGAATGDPYR